MGFEIFTRQVIRSGSPAITITTMGRMSFNKSATAVFEKNAVEYVLLLWDKDTQKCAVRPISKKDARAYRLSYGAKGNGAGYSCVTFLNFIGYDWSKTRSFPVEWNNHEDMFVFSIPKEHLIGKPQGQQLKLKRPDVAKAAMTKVASQSKEATTLTQ